MSYDVQEKSIQDGMPIELFLFRRSTGETYAYTNSETPQVRDSITYTPEVISRERITRADLGENKELRVTVPSTNPMAALWNNLIPGGEISFYLYQKHLTDSSSEYIQLFSGYIASASFLGDGRECTFSINPQTVKSGRIIPRRTYSSSCNNTHYGARCGLNADEYQEEMTVVTVGTLAIQVEGASNLSGSTYWVRGWLKFGDEYRLVIRQFNDFLYLNLPFRRSPLGATILGLPGCKHDISSCSAFDNVANYGGYPYVPTKNPFDTGID